MPGLLRLSAPVLVVAWLLATMAPPAAANPAPAAVCAAAIALVEPGSGLPPGLLTAIALVETGRAVPGGDMQPWPWSWNAAGRGGVARTKAAAVAAVGGLRAGGTGSVDVGCMQVNLLHHPDAFGSLEEAFDPVANVRYAASFLTRLRARLPDWEAAIRHYHSGNAARGEAYQRRVAMARLGRAWRDGAPASGVPASGAPALSATNLPPRGLCAPGARLVLVLRGTPDPRIRRRGARMVCLAPPRR